MSWGSWADFWAMGGYALYVWGSYAVAAGLIVGEIASLARRKRTALARLTGRGPEKEP
jgi:heme exporter protein D